MAFDQNSMPIDLRPINVARSGGEETRVGPSPVTTSGRPLDGFYSNPVMAPRVDVTSPPSMSVYYTDTSSAGAGFPSMGFVNPGGPNMGQATWWPPRMPVPVGPPPPNSISSPVYAYSPNLGPRVGGGGGGGGGEGNSGAVSGGSGTDQVNENGGDDSVSGKKVKFLCSFGGKILPRPSDGMLRYVGGQTRIISVRRDVTFGELVQKMVDIYGQPIAIKYQLPDEDLDALVSVSCSDDLDNMMEEYEKLQERSPDGSAKLRVFLFSASELDPSGLVQLGGMQDTGLRYVDAVNGVAEGIGGGITRKESIASVASTQNSDVSGSEVFETAVGQDVSGPPSAQMFSPRSDPAPSYDNANAPRFEISATPLVVPVSVTPPPRVTEPEFEQERATPFPVQGQKQPYGYDFQQSGINMQPRTSPYMGGYIDPHQDALNRGASQMVYANPQMFGNPRPILMHPQYRDNSPNLVNQHFMPAVQMTMGPNSSHMSMNPNILQPLVQSSQRVVAIPSDPSYNNAYQAQVGGSYRWPQVTPQDQAAFSEGWVSHQQVVPTTSDCYMCQKALPHAHSDGVVQDQNVSQTINVSDTNPIYQSLSVDDINRLHSAALQNQGLMGLASDASTPYGAVRGVPGPEDTMQQHLVSNPVNGDSAASSGAVYHPSEQYIPEVSKDFSGKVPGVAFREDAVRSVGITKDHVRPVDFSKESVQIKPVDIHSKNEQGKSHIDQLRKDDILEHVSPQTLGREGLPNTTFSRPTLLQDTSQMNQSEMLPCSVAEVQYQYNENPPGTDMRADATRFPAETITLNSNVLPSSSPHNWGAVGTDSSNSLFSNQDPWNMRHETPLPPKPSKLVTKRETSAADNRQNGELNAEVKFVDILPTTEQVQSGKGSAEEQVKKQLQATAEGVAASVLHSSVASNADFSSQETSVSEPNHEAGEQNNSDAVIKTKMEALNIKSDKANFRFPLPEGLGRLQIINDDDLEELRELGSGTFGTVYHGKWRGTDVAIKRINDRCFSGKPSEEDRMRDDFWNEAIKLADLHHPNVVAFYGVVLDGPGCTVATVTEYMVNGSLRTALQKNERNLDKRKRLLIAMDVAFGMEYLHSKNIVHFDLKSDNLLVNLRDPHRPICKVGDLGLSKVKCQTLISGGVRGTLPWMAPELLNGSSSLVSEKVDVFSFGIVMWELLTGEEPYADLHYGAIIGGIVSNTLRPPVPDMCDPEWRSLMERCWSAEPPERPNFTEIANELRVMASKVPAKGQTPATTPRTNT